MSETCLFKIEAGSELTICVLDLGHKGDHSPVFKTKVYVASPFELRNEAIRVMGLLKDKGHEVTSRWLSQLDEEGDKGARMDLADVARADALLLLNPEEYRRSGTGGRHCEFMHAWTLGKQVTICGVRSNIFHHLSNVRVIERAEDF